MTLCILFFVCLDLGDGFGPTYLGTEEEYEFVRSFSIKSGSGRTTGIGGTTDSDNIDISYEDYIPNETGKGVAF